MIVATAVIAFIIGWLVGHISGLTFGYRLRKKTVMETMSMEDFDVWLKRRNCSDGVAEKS